MPRNLDLTALRAFVTVAEAGGVTRAAGQLNLTQSAVSMQLKRLEEALGQPLLDRSGRGVALTPHGEKLLSHGRRMVALNDEIWSDMRDDAYEGEIRFGVPHDIVYPHVPGILRWFAAEHPKIKVHLQSSYTKQLRELFGRGEVDVILTTEAQPGPGGEVLRRENLIWVGAPGGTAWRQRPVRLAFETACIFRPMVQDALDRVDIPWEMAVDSESTRTIDATVSADLAIHANVEGHVTSQLTEIPHGGALPDLPAVSISMYSAPARDETLIGLLVQRVREAYGSATALAAE